MQTYHVGVWFNSPADVVKIGGPGTVTPFNGGHNAAGRSDESNIGGNRCLVWKRSANFELNGGNWPRSYEMNRDTEAPCRHLDLSV